MAGKMILLDVDDTLYPAGTGPFVAVVRRIRQYVEERLELEAESAARLRKQYVSRYGSTLGGLMAHHGVDPDEYLEYVHDVPVAELLHRDERLRCTLERLREPLAVFSSGSRGYVERVLEALGVADLFDILLTIESFDYIPKPQPHPYHVAMRKLKLPAQSLIMVDDRPDNVQTAIHLGMRGILVGPAGGAPGMPQISDIYALPDFIG